MLKQVQHDNFDFHATACKAESDLLFSVFIRLSRLLQIYIAINLKNSYI
jgi:hypothetical protein